MYVNILEYDDVSRRIYNINVFIMHEIKLLQSLTALADIS